MLITAITPAIAQAQHDQDHDHDDHDDHHHAPLHFAHPMFTESPTPDTKVRLDYLYSSVAKSFNDNVFRVEAEYAFSRNFSIEANVPLVSRSIAGNRTTAVGSSEIAAKYANFAAAKAGFLLGGGLAVELPTASNDAGIGSDHIVEVEPFANVGYMRGPMEIVTTASFSSATRRRIGEDSERALGIAASLLFHVGELEPLAEIGFNRALSGDESGDQSLNAGAGLKYHVPKHHKIVVGIAARAPVTSTKAFRHQILASFFYHF